MKNQNEISIMKKIILPFLLSLAFFTTTDAYSIQGCDDDFCCVDQKKFYAKIFGGANFLQNTSISGNECTYQPGYIVAGSLGRCFRCGVRLEAEYAYRNNTIQRIHFVGEGSSHHGHFQVSSCMGNLLWDLPLTSWGCSFWNIQPFIGGGLGYDFQQMHSSNSRIVFHQNWNRFSWQVMAGFAYPLFCNTELTLEYKYHQGGCHFYNNSVGVGIVYKFCLSR